LKSTFIGKQEGTIIREYLVSLDEEPKSNEEILNTEYSSIKKNKNNDFNPRSHG